MPYTLQAIFSTKEPHMKTLSLFSKPNSPQAWGVLNEVMHWAESKGLAVLPVPAKGGWDGAGWDGAYVELVRREADLAIAIGGDGTLLGVARSLFGSGVPVLGVNLGHLGFLTDVAAGSVGPMLDAIQAGHYDIERRILLEADIAGAGPVGLAFNDVVLSKGDVGRMVEYEVFVDGEAVYRLRADGLVIATPTGSTAYALSANGPILHPALPAVALVPLCPHSLSARPITLPSSARIELVVHGSMPARVFCDGQPFGDMLGDGARVRITQGATSVPMLHLRDYNIFKTLKQTLGWSAPRER
jgi:NAD+ kinase